MVFELPKLPFEADKFMPWMSAETFDFHHGKHHAGYVKKLNAAIEGTAHEEKTLEEIIRDTSNNPGIFNNAAQHFNHTVFWESMTPEKQEPGKDILSAIEQDFGSFEEFVKEFDEKAKSLFGSGWTWLSLDPEEGKLEVDQYSNAATPLTTGLVPLLPLDVWEHSYYIDHRNDRGAYVDGFWDHVNWEAVAKRLP